MGEKKTLYTPYVNKWEGSDILKKKKKKYQASPRDTRSWPASVSA